MLALLIALAVALPIKSSPVTLSGLLDEMVSTDSMARWPEHPFKLIQASSYDRKRTGPDKPDWFANSDSSNYIRRETHNGREELVLMDADGPGAIVRFFVTNAGGLKNSLRVYLDGSDQPVLESSISDLTKLVPEVGAPLNAPHPPPLGHGGSTLYLPIPYARHCKVTLQEGDPKNPGARYYHIDYRAYTRGTQVETFTKAGLAGTRAQIERVNQELGHPSVPKTNDSAPFEQDLAPKTISVFDLPKGPCAIRKLEFSVGADLSPLAREQALRSVVFTASFDDEASQCINCPVGDLIGSGAGGRPVHSWYRDVDEHGNAICRWTMPYREKGRASFANMGNQAVKVRFKADSGPWTWDDRSMYFHCNWRQQTSIHSRPDQDWNFVSVKGRGVLVGDVMSVFNPIPSWYGEGNEKIYTDGEYFPAILGTGTEDYYNASWAPNPVFQTPFANHPRIDEPRSQGQNVYTRARNLDGVPFDKSLQFDFEISTWNDSFVDYAATTYWYGAPGAKSNATWAPQEVMRPVPSLPVPLVLQGAIEGESLPVVAKSPGLVVMTQDMSPFSGTWSGNAQMLIRGRQVGDYVDLTIPAYGSEPRKIALYLTRANDYGVLSFWVNGLHAETSFDGYAPNPTALSYCPLGIFTPSNGKFVVRIRVDGCNPKCTGVKYLVGLDAVTISR